MQRRARPAARDAPEAGSASEADLEEPVEESDLATLPAGHAHDAMHVYEYHVVEICHPAPPPPTRMLVHLAASAGCGRDARQTLLRACRGD